MFRTRILMMLGGCLLVASAALADDVGYVDCSNSSDATQVFSKPRKSNDIVATVPCGERFVIVTYGFIFSRIQTHAGQVGYVYSSLISVDRAAASLPATPASATPSIQVASEKTKVASTPKTLAPSRPASAADQQPAATTAQAAAPRTQDLLGAPIPSTPPAAQTQIPAPDLTASKAAAAPVASAPEVKPNADAKTSSDAKPSTAQLEAQAEAALATTPAATSASSQPAPPAVAPASDATPKAPDVAPASPSAPSAPASAQPDSQPAAPAAALASDTMPKAPEPAASSAPAAAQPDMQPAAPVQPEASAPVEPAPAPAAVRASDRNTWEKPLPSARKTALFEFYGGYAFARMSVTTSSATNLGGGLGSVGWNFKSWLQFVGDASYTVVTGTGTKNILYGNHFGARYFYRNHNRYGLTPFVEGLVGGSRSDLTVSGASGYTTSASCISYKVGGGLDFHPIRHVDVRLFDVDYYRTSFGTGQQQTNIWASAGIVIHIFGGGEQ